MMNTNSGVIRHERTLRRAGIAETCLGLQHEGEDPLAVFRDFPVEPGTVVGQLVFGGCAFHQEASLMMDSSRWPMMWLQGDPCNGQHVSGFQALLLKGAAVERVVLDGRVVGSRWADADAEYCLLAGVMPGDVTRSREAQAREVFERMEQALGSCGLNMLDVVRTWLYLDHLLDWYGAFNAVRTRFFRERGVFEKLIPASTGIGARNPGGAALLAGALAVRPRHAGVRIEAVPSPLQCPAPDYDSSFSRAVELGFPGRRQLLVSGTASIDPGGATAHRGDVAAQIGLTMSVTEAILQSRGMRWADTTRAIAYFQDIREAPLLTRYCRDHGLTDFPVIHAHTTVCRDDLLFELELDAVK